MGRGLAQRRRLKNYETAKQEKSGTVPLPPPPGELERKKRKRSDAQSSGPQGPASFRRMLAMKALVESKQGPGKAGRQARQQLPPPPQQATGAEAAPAGKRRKLPPADKPLSSLLGSPLLEGQPAAERARTAKAAPDTLLLEQAAEGPFRKRGMKESKKEFLKKRKAKRRGRAAEAAEAAEEQLREDASRPAFGEQALQPIKVNLKRKHWAGSAEERAQSRVQAVFQQQMARAKAQAAARSAEAQKPGLAQSFKRQQRGGKQAPAAATPASLAALARQGAEAAAAAGSAQ